MYGSGNSIFFDFLDIVNDNEGSEKLDVVGYLWFDMEDLSLLF